DVPAHLPVGREKMEMKPGCVHPRQVFGKPVARDSSLGIFELEHGLLFYDLGQGRERLRLPRYAPRLYGFEPAVDLYRVENIVRRQQLQDVFFEVLAFERPVYRYRFVGLEKRDDGERRDCVVRYFVSLAVRSNL